MEEQLQPVGQAIPEKQITVSFPLSEVVALRWRQIAQEKCIPDDSMLAAFLVRCYEERQGNQEQSLYCENCRSPLTQFCSACFTLIPKQQANSIQTVSDTDDGTGLQNEIDKQEEHSDTAVEKEAAIIKLKVENEPEESATVLQKESTSHNESENGYTAASDTSSDVEDCSTSSLSGLRDVKVGIKFEEDFSKPELVKSDLLKNVSDADQPSETFACDFCLQLFFDPDLLIIHMQEHSDLMLHECDECKARFFQPDILKVHMKIHNQKKKYACDQCDVFMSRLDNLNRHKALKHNKKSTKRTRLPGTAPEEEENVFFKGVIKFTCDQCGKGFARRDNYNRHLLTHSGEKRYSCQQCGVAFAHLSKLVTHMHLHTSHKPFQCGKCHKCFIDSASMTRHVCKGEGPKLHCKACGKKFATSGQLILHSRLHRAKEGTSQLSSDSVNHKPNEGGEHLKSQDTNCSDEVNNIKTKIRAGIPRSCSLRSKAKKTSKNKGSKGHLPPSTSSQVSCTKNTVEADTESHPHCCQFCGARFLFQSHLTRHEQNHTGEKAFKCFQCPVSCGSLARLEIHLRSHTASKNFPCHYCGKVLKSAYALKLHVCSHTGEKPFKCEDCGECFTHKSKYNDHMNVHTGERRHLCPYCGKAFLRSSNLSGHIRIHTHTRKDYPCQYCGKILKSRNTLREHLRSHTGEKPFKCDVCGTCFMRSGTYKTHVRKHSGVKPHPCPFCSKSFLHPCHLRVHVRIHTGEKPYKCTLCPKAFSISAGLKEHMRKHTGDKPFKCSVCGKSFAKSCNRLAHFRTHRKSQANPPMPSDTAVD